MAEMNWLKRHLRSRRSDRRNSAKSASLASMVSNASSSAIRRVDALALDAIGVAGKDHVARRLQPLHQSGMGVDQAAEGGRAFHIGIVERRLGAQISGEAPHRFGQHQPPGAVIEQKREDTGIERIDQRARHEEIEIEDGIAAAC